MEIERKFTIRKLPDMLEQYEYADIIQGYLLRKPVVRVRKWNDDYILTYKSKQSRGEGAIVNIEEEFPLTEEGFYHLLNKCDNNAISKRRYLIPLEEATLGDKRRPGRRPICELDVFDGCLKGLVFAEVEFDSVEEADAFIMPDWFLEDVTNDKRYSNGYLTTISHFEN